MRLVLAGLVAALGLFASPTFAASCDGFTDVDSSSSFCSAVTYIKDKGITLGCTGTAYCPNEFVTRLQMAAFLQRAGQGDPSNTLGGHTDAIGGGISNSASGGRSFIGGGSSNIASAQETVVGGGISNVASALWAVVAGGIVNTASGQFSAVGGGEANTASGYYGTIPGGLSNNASGDESFAAGTFANANYPGCFVWGDNSTGNPVYCNAANRFVVRSLGGIFMFTGGSQQDQYTGVVLAPGASAWVVGSDRNGKEEFQAIDADDVLRRVAALPISTWKWKHQDASIRHMGPMAQDFAAAFNLGETPLGISTVDADGVALAAIQGLNAKVDDKDARIAALERAIAQMQARVDALTH